MQREIHLLTSMHPELVEAGCDEAGRGPLAGPVFAAAVILPKDFHHPLLNDSKKMSEKSRDILRPIIEKEAVAWAVEEVSAAEIDQLNILWASVTGMQRAVRRLSVKPEFLLIDGNRFRPFDEYRPFDGIRPEAANQAEATRCEKVFRYQTVVHGDATYACIAAASVLAKTWRDEHMRRLAEKYPQYGWERNMGYPTAEHIAAIREYGYTPEHRRSFHPKELEITLFDQI